MILNQYNDEFEYNGIKYIVGERIIANDQSVYNGLFGYIWEIRDGKDKETENDAPDFYCSFDLPVLPNDLKRLESVFSELYQTPKTLDEISLDSVIMAPEMVQPVPNQADCCERPKWYFVEENWSIDAECGHAIGVYPDYIEAKLHLHESLLTEKEDGCILLWKHLEHFKTDSNDSSYTCWLEGDYCDNHYEITLREESSL